MTESLNTAENIKQLAISAFCENSNLSGSYQEIFKAYIIFLTLPVTTATPERTFSKLKLIKNYLRNRMTQDRLSNLSILSIEKEMAQKTDFSKIVDQFASVNAKREYNFKNLK